MICAHMILDASRDADVHMVTDRFEVGMYGEAPGIISESVWPIARDHWLSKTGFNHPGAGDTAIRSSWMKKSMAISLADRGAHFHTGTHTTEESTEGKEVTLSYPGGKTTTRIAFDYLVVANQLSDRVWRGAVTTKRSSEEFITGRRPDGTYELWWEGRVQPQNPLQLMEWAGEDPREALREAVALAASKLSNLKKQGLST